MTTATVARPLSFAGAPLSAWAFGVRIWIAMVVALAASFWLELEVPSTAAVTVAILAAPTRGQALEKATYRLFATFIGVTAAIAITAFFSQTRDLLILAFAGWMGLCVYAAGLLDGNRAYASVLSGYTVAFVAVPQIDTPGQVFETGMARGAAIAVGIAAIGIVNDMLVAPDRFPQLASQLTVLHRRVRDYAKAVLRDKAPDAATAAGLLRDVAALRSETASLVTESASGSVRSTAARSTAVALVAEVYAARSLDALTITDPSARDMMASALDRRGGTTADQPCSLWPLAAHAFGEVLSRDDAVRDGLAALSAGTRPQRVWGVPPYRSHIIAIAGGIRAAACFLVPSAFYVLAGWPGAAASLSLVTVLIGLGATTPNPTAFTIVALIAAPIASFLAGTLEFLILDGATEFPPLALALSPFVIGATVLLTQPNPLVSGIGRFNLIFILGIVAPNNPPAYDPQTFLFTSLFLVVAIALLLAAQTVIPAPSIECRQCWLLASARRDFVHVLSRRSARLSPEESMFRDASRIGQILSPGTSSRDSAARAEALSYFDRSAAIRLCRASLARLADSALSHLIVEAEKALAQQDTHRLRAISNRLKTVARTGSAITAEVSTELALTARVIDATTPAAARAARAVS